ncbi:glycoside hydrolase family 28 protein [Patescibacteria group bacterium]|nr:MAG: glycoside hydrolase family 28 protein [Patescibacteria group bacterium]
MNKRLVGSLVSVLLLLIAGWFVLAGSRSTVIDTLIPPPFAMADPVPPQFPDKRCVITDYGANQSSTSDTTEAVKRAVNDCTASGGGHVVVPEGVWPIGPIKLASHIDLHLDRGAELQFDDNPALYLPVVFTRFEGIELMNYSPLIYVKDATDIAITGEGKLNGQNKEWQKWKGWQSNEAASLYEMGRNGVPVAERVFGSDRKGLRPSFVQFINCKNILLEQFSITSSPMWTIHPVYSENILIRNLTIDTEGHNTDGIVIDSSRNVLIENSEIKSGDDNIAIKSGLDQDGWRVNRPSENVIIRNCIFTGGHSAVAIGSEMSGGIRNVLVENSRLPLVDQGVRIKSVDGRGGIVENVWVKNIEAGVIDNAVFQIDLTYDATSVESKNRDTPTIQNIYVDDIRCEQTKYAVRIEGLKEKPINHVIVTNLSANTSKGNLLSNISNSSIFNVLTPTQRNNPTFSVTNASNLTVTHPTCTAKCFKFLDDTSTNVVLQSSNLLERALHLNRFSKSTSLK